MPKGNKPSIQDELDGKLRQMQLLIGASIDLVAQLREGPKQSAKPSRRMRGNDTSIRFEMNERAFVKRYAANLSGGPKKFVLVLAFLTKGDASKEVSLNQIEQLWNRMKSKALLGMKFNRFFPTTAKENGWVNSQRRGFYSLDRSWKSISIDD